MGLFSSKKKVSVDSVTYNLSGDYKDRTIYWKPNVVGSTFRTEDLSTTTGDRIFNNYLFGPGVRLRNTYKWLRRKDYWSMTNQNKAYFTVGSNIDYEVIINNIPKKSDDETITIEDANIDFPDIATWASKWIIDNYDEYIDSDWTVESVPDHDDQILITLPNIGINLPGGEYTIDLIDFENDKKYLSVYFQRVHGKNEIDREEIKEYEVNILPSYDRWSKEVISTKKEIIELKTKITIKEIIEEEEVITTEEHYRNIPIEIEDIVFRINEYIDGILYIREVNSTSNYRTVTKTTIENVDNKEIITEKEDIEIFYDIKEKTIIYKKYYAEPIELMIYKEGTGNTELDSLFSTEQSAGNVFPIIPIRVNKRNISPNYYNNIYEANKKIFSMSMDSNYDELIKEINKSPSIGDINHCFMRIGISINTKDYGGREYLYRFFKEYLMNSGKDGSEMKNFLNEWKQALEANENELLQWVNASVFTRGEEPPKYGSTPYPSIYRIRGSGINQVGGTFQFGLFTSWSGVDSTINQGNVAGVNHIDLSIGKNYGLVKARLAEVCTGKEENNCRYILAHDLVDNISSIKIKKQLNRNTYEELEIYELRQVNNVHAGHGETYEAYKELRNPNADDSELVIPLSIDLFKRMSIHHFTQASTCSFNITFNSYKISKVRWWQKDVFKIVVVVASIAVSVWFPPAGAGVGAMTSSISIGTAIGLTGAAAMAAGALIKLAVSVVMTRIITNVFTSLFGDIFGSILGSFAVMIAGGMVDSWASGNPLLSNFDKLMNMGNLFSLTSSVFNGYTANNYNKIMIQMQNYQNELNQYSDAMDKLNDKMSLLNTHNNMIDPIRSTRDSTSSLLNESPEVFLSRTLLVGSDIVDANLAMIDKYTSLTLKLGD